MRKKTRFQKERRKYKGPPFEGRIRNFGLSYLRKHFWKMAAISGWDDLEQDAFLMYWKVRRYHPEIVSEKDFLKFYRVCLYGLMVNRSRSCFPNPYNAGSENHCSSLTGVDGSDLTDVVLEGQTVYNTVVSEVEEYLSILSKIPAELHEVFSLLVREVSGLGEIEVKRRTKLNGDVRVEPFRVALARIANKDLNRDLLAEIGECLGSVMEGSKST